MLVYGGEVETNVICFHSSSMYSLVKFDTFATFLFFINFPRSLVQIISIAIMINHDIFRSPLWMIEETFVNFH